MVRQAEAGLNRRSTSGMRSSSWYPGGTASCWRSLGPVSTPAPSWLSARTSVLALYALLCQGAISIGGAGQAATVAMALELALEAAAGGRCGGRGLNAVSRVTALSGFNQRPSAACSRHYPACHLLKRIGAAHLCQPSSSSLGHDSNLDCR